MRLPSRCISSLTVLACFIYLTNMAYKRTFAVSISNSANVKWLSSGAIVANEVARKELNFWLPFTIPLLDSGVQGVSSFYNFPNTYWTHS